MPSGTELRGRAPGRARGDARLPRGLRCLRLAAAAAVVLAAAAVRAEVCDDCADDDRDALVDCHDPDCFTSPACSTSYLSALASPPTCAPTLALRPLWTSPLGDYATVPAVGDIDADGIPEVVFTTLRAPPRLVVLDGATGSLERESDPLPGPLWHGQVAIADIDADGTAEVFAGEPCSGPGQISVIRLEHDAGRTWSDVPCGAAPTWNGGIALADFDADGRPEVFQFGNISDAVDGTRLVQVNGLDEVNTGFTVAADVLPDDACTLCAGLELVASTSVWAIDLQTGAFEQAARVRDGWVGGYPVVVDWDGDGRSDVATLLRSAFSDSEEIIVWDPRSERLLARSGLDGDLSSSVPAVADFDGDRELEIALVTYIVGSNPDAMVIRVLDHDMSVLRDIPIAENSFWTTVTSFDFDADGAAEIVHRGSEEVRVMSALDGSTRLSGACPAGTSGERAVVVDVNADGHADILSGCDGGILRAWSVDGSVAARRVMNQWNYDVVDIEDDLTVPCSPQPEGAPGLPPGINGAMHQVPLMRDGRSPAEICRCPSKPTALVVPPQAACRGTTVVLDGRNSPGCSGDRIHRWTDDAGRVVSDWTSDATLAVVAGESEHYVLTVACGSDPWCRSSVLVRLEVLETGEEPAALDARPLAEPLRVAKTDDPLLVRLTWEDTGAASYRVYGGLVDDLAPDPPRPQAIACELTIPRADVPAPGPGWWFLAVGACSLEETSYGRDSFGVERAPAGSRCP